MCRPTARVEQGLHDCLERERRECCEKRRASVVALIKYALVRKKKKIWQSRRAIGE